MKMLDLSTAHISMETAAILDRKRETDAPFRHLRHEYGWIVFVTEPEEEYGEFPELRDIMLHAFRNGCMLINLDADGEISKDLKTFEW